MEATVSHILLRINPSAMEITSPIAGRKAKKYKRALTASRGNIGYHIERAKTFDRVEDQEQKERCQFFERCGLEDVSENF